MNLLSTALLPVYKRLRSQVRGSQSRRCRCLRSELKVVLVPCIFEHNLKSYIMFQLCEDVFCLQIKSTGNGAAPAGAGGCALQCSRAHRDYHTQGLYCLIVAQIDYCLGLLRIGVYVWFSQERCFPPSRNPFFTTSHPFAEESYTLWSLVAYVSYVFFFLKCLVDKLQSFFI